MKSAALLSGVLLLASCLAAAGTKVNTGTWTSDDAIKTHYWKEVFSGGGAGHTGNVLIAFGAGFHLTKATLESVNCSLNYAGGYLDCTTTYTGGELFLNAGGPWLKSGNVIVRDITVRNSSRTYGAFDADGFRPNGQLEFRLEFTREFVAEGGAYTITVSAAWGPGIPETRVEKKVVIQRGSDYECSVTITGPPET